MVSHLSMLLAGIIIGHLHSKLIEAFIDYLTQYEEEMEEKEEMEKEEEVKLEEKEKSPTPNGWMTWN